MNYAIVENGVVVNVAVWNGTSPWSLPAGSEAVPIPPGAYVGIGSSYANGAFSSPPQIPSPIV